MWAGSLGTGGDRLIATSCHAHVGGEPRSNPQISGDLFCHAHVGGEPTGDIERELATKTCETQGKVAATPAG